MEVQRRKHAQPSVTHARPQGCPGRRDAGPFRPHVRPVTVRSARGLRGRISWPKPVPQPASHPRLLTPPAATLHPHPDNTGTPALALFSSPSGSCCWGAAVLSTGLGTWSEEQSVSEEFRAAVHGASGHAVPTAHSRACVRFPKTAWQPLRGLCFVHAQLAIGSKMK